MQLLNCLCTSCVCMFFSFYFRLAPIGVCSLVAARIAAMDDIVEAMGKLGLYMVTVLCGFLVHSLIVIPLVFFVVTRKNPYDFMKGLKEALMTAFGISSRFVDFTMNRFARNLNYFSLSTCRDTGTWSFSF